MSSSRRSRRLSHLFLAASWMWAAPSAGAEQVTPDCGTDNLLAGKLPSQQFQIRGDSSLVTDGAIYRGILSYRRYPEELFVGPRERLDALRTAIFSRAY